MRLVVVLAQVFLSGCFVDIDFGGTRFNCADGECPEGFACVDGTCVASDGGAEEDAGGDAGSGDAAAALMTCEEQFSLAPGYTLCTETETTCEFFVTAEPAALCADICAQYAGATCQASYDATGGGTECVRETADEACAAPHTGQICVCTRSAAST